MFLPQKNIGWIRIPEQCLCVFYVSNTGTSLTYFRRAKESKNNISGIYRVGEHTRFVSFWVGWYGKTYMFTVG
jgi:hypothetical protein